MSITYRDAGHRVIPSKFYTAPERTPFGDEVRAGEPIRKIEVGGTTAWVADRTVGLLRFRCVEDGGDPVSSFTLGNPCGLIENLPPNTVVFVAEHGASDPVQYVREDYAKQAWGRGSRDCETGRAAIGWGSGKSSPKAFASRMRRSSKVFAYCIRTPDESCSL